ncbi:class I SAM-dependent methyltransferase [Streptomyces catenulae]|uniref:Class I SAM-dependent methyltransferase n=1 Tax=Streptomyces catenulae TaxID=66875 RepID=A0ABV2YYX9_9ACTN|nr:class I SAM-dependent methyltransferase [Streptomyces catenulae]
MAYEAGFGRLCAHTVPLLLDAAGVRAGTVLLDVGCGTGTVAVAGLARGARVTAVDAEDGMVRRTAVVAGGAAVHRAALPRLPFADGVFDAAAGNFVLNHVGRPREALAELCRVVRPGGRIALTVWAVPAAPGQTLLGRAVAAAGVARPGGFPAPAPQDDFPRTAPGLAGLLRGAGLTGVACRSVVWNHRATPEEWWRGPAAGVATIGQTVISQGPEVTDRIARHFRRLALPFTGPDGRLVLPHRALLALGVVPERTGAGPGRCGGQRPRSGPKTS